jgi:hypothetical protein
MIMANQISFVGKIRKIKDGYSEQEFSGGLIKRKLRFQALCDSSVQWLEVNTFVWKNEKTGLIDEKKNKVYTLKSVEGAKDEKMTVEWANRLNPDVVSSVPGYKRFVVDTDTFAHRKELEDEKLTEELEKSKKKRKEFIHEADFIDYLIKVLDNEKSKDMIFRINGTVEYSYGSKKDMHYRSFVPQKIFRVADDTEQCCAGSMKLYFTEGAVDDTCVDETGDYVINAFVDYYDQNAKMSAFAPISVKIAADHKMANGFKKRFSKAEGDEIKELGVGVDFINGAKTVDITEDMLSDEQREAIEDGMCTFEDIKAELGGTAFGERVTEIRLTGLMKGYSSGVQDTMYSIEDLVKKPIKEEPKNEVVKDDEKVDIFGDDDDEI